MRSETQSTHDKLEKIGLALEKNVQMTEEIKEKFEVIYDRDRDRPESQKIQGKHVMVDRCTDKSEEHPAKRSRLHTIKPDPLYQAPVMSPTHNNLLLQKRPMLIKDLQVEDIIPHMVARGILSERNADKIKAQKTEQEQAFEFLCILPKCGPRAFETFVEVLREHNKKELADLLAEKATTCSSKNQIANFYISHMSQIQRLPWDPNDTMHMDEVYVNLQWVQEENKPTGTSSKSVENYTSIFEDTKQGKRPKRILVRGKAGIGKTTFTQKMATDWANDAMGFKKCKEVLSTYEHLILLNLRSIQSGQTLKEAIGIQIPCSAETRRAVVDEIMHALDNNSGHVLLVFDGYDEYDPKTSQEITEVINCRRYQDVCTIITTRPWKAEKLMNRRIMDSVYEITGLTEDNIAQYVANFFDEKKTRKGLLKYLDKMRLMSLAEIPILLLFICLLWEDQLSDSSTVSLPGSYTLLYESLIQLLIKRRYNIRSQKKVSEYLEKLKHTFFNIGKLALEGLLKPDGGLVFDEEDLKLIPNISELYSLGLLNKSKVHCNLDVKYQVTFLHKTIQELFAAEYLAGTIVENDHVLDEFLGRLNTLDRLYDMEYVLRFLCGLSEQAIAKVRPRAQELAKMDASLKHIYSSNTEIETSGLFNIQDLPIWFIGVVPFDIDIANKYIQHFNNFLLEHWYGHCHEERDMTPELTPWHTILSIPYSFKHSDPRFQEVLDNSLYSNEQIWKNVFQDVTTVIWDPTRDTSNEAIHLLMMCEVFRNLSLIFWINEIYMDSNCTKSALKYVLSNAPNLNTLCINRCFDSSYLSLIPNPAKLRNLLVSEWHVLREAPQPVSAAPEPVDTQILSQMSSLKYLHLENGTCESLKNVIWCQLPFSRGLTHLVIRYFPLTAECVKILGKNLHHVPGLEHLKLVHVHNPDTFLERTNLNITQKFLLSRRMYCKRCTKIDQQEDENHGCRDFCEALLVLGHGVTRTPKLKYLSLENNDLGMYCGITSPLTALVQSLCTVSEQTRMEIDLSRNYVHHVDGLKEQIESIASSYPHVTLTF